MTEPDAESAPERGSEQPLAPRSPGAALLAERRNQGLSLGDIARQLKLSVRQVEALERDEYSSFSGSVFVRGFLRNYAKLLRLDPDRLVEAAGASIAPVRLHQPAVMETPMSAPDHERRRRILTWSAFAVLAFVVLLLLASNASKEQRATQVAERPLAPPPAASTPEHVESPPAMPSQAAAEPAAPSTVPAPRAGAVPAPDSQSTAQPNPSATGVEAIPSPLASAPGSPGGPAADSLHIGVREAVESAPVAKPKVLVTGSGSNQIRMIFEDESWVEVRDGSGETIFSRLNEPGTERLIRGLPPFVVVVGNAHAVRLLYQGRPIDLGPHTRVDVARVTLE
jgi:cytoskeleton protein RodZ